MTTDVVNIAPEKQKTLFGHPAGLFVLFFTEMWERFSYYGMRALLTLYMVRYLIADPERAQRVLGFETLRHLLETGFGPLDIKPLSLQIYGLYTGFVYLSPFFGGVIADRVWGQKRTVYVGGFLMAIGHFLMASEQMFLLALFFMILGNGAFKPNISTQVGNLYPQGDPRRDGAFTLFYMGVNLGAFFSPLVCGTLGQSIGWHWGFGTAGVGMLVGLAIYHFGRHLLPLDRHQQANAQATAAEKVALNAGKNKILFQSVFGFLAAMVLFFGVLILPATLKLILIAVVLTGIVFAISRIKSKDDRARVVVLSLVSVASVAFWAIYEQQGGTMQLWADESTVWPTLNFWPFNNFQIPTTWYQSFNPVMIFVFAPFLDMIWNHRARKGKASTSVRKMGTGCLLTGLAFIVMIICVKVTGEGIKSGLWWIVLTTWIVTMGELYLSPIGLSLVTKVSPKHMVSMMMGVNMMANFIGNYLSGYIGSFYDRMPKEDFFLILSSIGVIVGVLFILSERYMKKTIGDV